MNIVLITDAWEPQVNGVVRTWSKVIETSQAIGHRWLVIHPGLFRTAAAPRYPEIRLAWRPGPAMAKLIDDWQPDAIHISTEGPLGLAGRRLCVKRGWPFSTSYHTQFPMYLRKYFGVPAKLSYRFLRWFHKPATATLVPTAAVARELAEHGLEHLAIWTRGVDTRLFTPIPGATIPAIKGRPGPIFLYAGRVAHEKNIEAFLKLDLPGTKVVVGDGPLRAELARKYPQVHFAGYQFGEDLARHYAAADVFVFPSRSDTFGVVLLEAGACGLPVAAYPVTGPIDVVHHGVSGYLDEDLRIACLAALKLNRQDAIDHARQFTWERCTEVALSHLHPRKPLKLARSVPGSSPLPSPVCRQVTQGRTPGDHFTK